VPPASLPDNFTAAVEIASGLASRPVAVMSTTAQLEGSSSRHTRPLWRAVVLPAVGLAAALAVGCGGGGGDQSPRRAATPAPVATDRITYNPDNEKVRLTIGSKNFTEQKVLGEIYAQGLVGAGYDVRTRLGIGDQDAAFRALKAGEVDAYPEYTGTALLAFFGKKADDLPKDPEKAYEEAKRGFADQTPPLVAYPPTPFTSSNEVAVSRRTARRLRLKRISDLRPHAKDLTLYGSPECRTRLDCLAGLREVYGLKFKRFKPIPIAQRHRVLRGQRADVSIVFTTDPQIRRENEVLLEDDKGMFPPYNTTLVVRKEIADRAGPDLAKTVALLQEQLTAENMQELNARVDLDGNSPTAVAGDYLQETGLVSAG